MSERLEGCDEDVALGGEKVAAQHCMGVRCPGVQVHAHLVDVELVEDIAFAACV